MADKKVSALSAINTLSQDDLLMVVNDPAGTPESKKVTVGNLFGNVVVDTTHKGDVTFTANTNHTGETATFSSNVNISSTLTVNGHNINSEISDRLQVANASLIYATNNYVQTFAGLYTTNSQFQLFKESVDKASNTNHNNVNINFRVGASGNTAYVFAGGGSIHANNETLTLYKGFSYLFDNRQFGNTHPFSIKNSANGAVYSNGVTGNTETEVFFTVPQNQVSNLVYQCSTHPSMTGVLVIK